MIWAPGITATTFMEPPKPTVVDIKLYRENAGKFIWSFKGVTWGTIELKSGQWYASCSPDPTMRTRVTHCMNSRKKLSALIINCFHK